MQIDLGLHQGQQLSQQLNLAPQLLNWLRLLQCPTTELSAMVARELESNPTLESDGPVEADATVEELTAAERDPDGTNGPTTKGSTEMDAKIEFLGQIEGEWRHEYQQHRSRNPDQEARHQYMMDSISESCSLQEHLLRQLSSMSLTGEEYMLAEFIVGSLDDRGYLTCSMEELCETTATPAARIEKALTRVQSLEPAGVGARDLSECLMLQMGDESRRDQLATRIVIEHLYLLAAKAFEDIAVELDAAVEDVEEAALFIATLDPCPGHAFSPKPVEYVSPDMTVRWDDDAQDFVIDLNDAHIPRLRLSATCKHMLEQKEISSKDRAYIREKMRTASFLIQGISQRQETLYKVAEEILRVQREWFDGEEGQLKPLTMAKVASVIGVHETTVSRALASKYIRTERGIFELRHFFRSGYLCSDGTAVTPDTVKDYIKDLIGKEDPKKPLTDLQLVNMLKERGLDLARRTIAKYRDEMKVPASKDRKVGGSKRRKLKVAPAPPEKPVITSNDTYELAHTG